MWVDHQDFKNFVANHWHYQGSSTAPLVILQLQGKLKGLKSHLKQWNWNSFGNLKTLIAQAQDDIIRADANLQLQWSQGALNQLNQAKGYLTTFCLSLSLQLERCSASPRVCLTRSVGNSLKIYRPFERKIEHWIKRVH